MSSCGFGEWRDLARSEVLHNSVRDCSSCDVCNNLHEQVSRKSYQCPARMPRGPGSLNRGIRRSVLGTRSATSARKRFDTEVWTRTAGSGSAGKRLLISWTTCCVTGTSGAFLAAAGSTSLT